MSKIVIVLFAIAAVGAAWQIPTEDHEKDFIFNFSWNLFPNTLTTPAVPPAYPACLHGIVSTVSCQCGTVFCTAGQSCDVATNTCNYSPACPAGVAAPTSCQCGTNPTFCQVGDTCYLPTSTCYPQHLPLCPDQNGGAVNTMTCTCGTTNTIVCTAAYCFAQPDGTGIC